MPNTRDIPDGFNGGLRVDPRVVEGFLNDPLTKHPVFAVSAAQVCRDYIQKDTFLSRYLLRCSPSWARGRQLLGSCVGWGVELVSTILNAKRCVKHHRVDDFEEASTEGCYGGARCEGAGVSFAGWRDGAYGANGAKFVRDFGVPFRRDYSQGTGVKDHDLRWYSGDKEKRWGAYGCGGRYDQGRLDNLVKESPVGAVSLAAGFDDVAASIAGAQCPVTIASSYGCSMLRNSYGECRWDRRWMHQMCLIDVRFGSHPAARCFQSWGPQVASGPSGDEYCELPPEWANGTPGNILGCSWWIPAEDVDAICRQQDSWCFSDIDGWQIEKFDWQGALLG